MVHIPIKRAIERVPGGMMVVPLMIGAIINTFFPETPKFFGSFTGAMFNGMPTLAMFFVCMGASIDIRTTPHILKKGGALFATKITIGVIMGLICGHFWGEAPVTSGVFAGMSALAIVAAMNDTNGGLYCALMGQYGNSRDVGAYSIMSLESGPFLTMVTLGVAGLAGFPWPTMVGAILPMVLGMILGNLDPEMRAFLKKASLVVIPFFAFGLGSGLDLSKVWNAGLIGVGTGIAVVAITGTALFFSDRLTGGTGVAGVAAATTAGNAAGVPAIIAVSNPVYAEAAKSATVVVAACVVTTAILVPFVTAWVHSKVGSGEEVDEVEAVETTPNAMAKAE